MAQIIQHRRDTKANWETYNPILAAGEIGIELDTNSFKLGNGLSSWSTLEYFNPSLDEVAIQALIDSSIPTIDTTDTPTIALPLEVNELSIVNIIIENYDANTDYFFNVSSGSISSNFPFKWYVGEVTENTTATLSCYAIKSGNLKSATSINTVTIIQDDMLSIIDDDTFNFGNLEQNTKKEEY